MQSLTANQKVVCREMALDLCYRLRLFNELFQKSASTALSAVATENRSLREAAVRILHQDSQALQLIAVDYNLIVNAKRFIFPVEVSSWLWELPDADTVLIDFLERLRDISLRMEKGLRDKLNEWEERS